MNSERPNNNFVPVKFLLVERCAHGEYYKLELKDEIIHESDGVDIGSPEEIPTRRLGNLQANCVIQPEKWITFRNFLDMLNVWEWNAYYESEYGYMRGGNWELEIEYQDGKVIKSSGNHAYPSNWDVNLLPILKDWVSNLDCDSVISRLGDVSLDYRLLLAAVAWITDTPTRHDMVYYDEEEDEEGVGD